MNELKMLNDMRAAQKEALLNKTNQKMYRVYYDLGGFILTKDLLAANKTDAKALARVRRVVKVEAV